MEKILRINLRNKSIYTEKLPDNYMLLGGRGLTSKILLDEVKADCMPLGKYNKLVFAVGLLCGTSAPCSGRLSVGGKSPLTGGVKESNAGGTAAQRIARLGYRAIIFEEKPQENRFFIVLITKDNVQILPGDDLAGLGNYETAKRLFERFGKKISIISIGQAGEMCLPLSGIAVTDPDGRPSRFAARGGLGALMGSKRIKAIIIDDEGGQNPQLVEEGVFREAVKEFITGLREHPVTGKAFPKYGTAVNVNIVNSMGALPTRNFSSGSFEGAEKISGETLHDLILQRGGEGKTTHACMPGCVIRCSNVFPDKEGKTIVAPLEYETIGLLGSNCGIDDLDEIAELNYLCNDLGVDTIETGATLAIAMEAGLLSFGDAKRCKELLHEIGRGTILGRVLGQGAAVTGRVLGVERVPVVKNQAMPAYDPRAIKGNIALYSTCPMGADHTAGNTLRAPDPLSPEGKVEISRKLQINTAVIDSLGICLIAGIVLGGRPDLVAKMLKGRYGVDLDEDMIYEMGKEVLRNERQFNRLAGFTNVHDRVPEYFKEEKLPPHNTVCDIPDEEIDKMFDF